jgi:LPPG:FO 2-phospho-L-lactate transferase
LRAVVICPSNPFISIDPILSIPGMRAALKAGKAPVVAVSPIIGGRAVKGPTAKMMGELGLDVSAAAVARHYGGLIGGFIADREDAARVAGLNVPVTVTNTKMIDLKDRVALARATLEAADMLGRAGLAAE